MSQRLSALVADASRTLQAAGLSADESRKDAVLLARHVLRLDAAGWLLRAGDPPPAGFTAAFEASIARRFRREPVAYITAEREFYGRPFRVTGDVLIPRQESELLVDEVRAVAPQVEAGTLVDLGTGSGCLAITLALETSIAHVVAIDKSPAAIAIARTNARTLGALDRIDFRVGSWTESLKPGSAAVIVVNPPYVPERDRAVLAPEVRDYEPAAALFAGDDGLAAIRVVVAAAAVALAPGGYLVMEIGQHQDGAVADLVAATPNLSLLRIEPDLQSIPRVVVAHVPVLSNRRG